MGYVFFSAMFANFIPHEIAKKAFYCVFYVLIINFVI